MKYADSLQLVNACRAGDRVAVETFVRAYQLPLYRLALSLLNDAQEADEATQDALVIALEKLDTFRGQSQLKTWVYTIALNVCRGHLRKRKTRERLTAAWHTLTAFRSANAAQPHDIAATNEQNALLWQAIQRLPDSEREAVVLRYYHELDLNEIARVVGVSDRTIRTRLHNALASLHQQLNGKVNEP